jgi:hypothetical protein
MGGQGGTGIPYAMPHPPPYVPPKYATPAGPDIPTPTLNQTVSTAPGIPGVDWAANGGVGGPGTSDTTSPLTDPYSVSPGSLRDGENLILAATQTVIPDYNDLKAYVDQVKGWIFQVHDPKYLGNGSLVNIKNDKGEIIDGATMTADYSLYMDQVLRGAADSITLTGRLVAYLNHAAQSYAQADIHSVLPTPEPPVGPPLGIVHDNPAAGWRRHQHG